MLDNKESNRRMILLIEHNTLLDLFKAPADTEWRVLTNALPEDVTCIGVFEDHYRYATGLVLVSESFAPVAAGELIPRLPPCAIESRPIIRSAAREFPSGEYAPFRENWENPL